MEAHARIINALMVLDLYLKDHGSARRLARDTGISGAEISRLRNGLKKASFRTAVLIEAATAGAVKADVLCDDAAAFKALNMTRPRQ